MRTLRTDMRAILRSARTTTGTRRPEGRDRRGPFAFRDARIADRNAPIRTPASTYNSRIAAVRATRGNHPWEPKAP
jgi:hypothetical protein